MKDLNLALYINLGDLDASEIGEKSSHTSRDFETPTTKKLCRENYKKGLRSKV